MGRESSNFWTAGLIIKMHQIMKSQRFFLSLLTVLALSSIGYGQKTYTLDQCLEIALKNNNGVQLAMIDQGLAKVELTRAKQSRMPFAEAGIGHGLNFGRSIDPATNDFVNQQISRGGFSGNANITIWQNNATNHLIKQSQYAEEAARWAVKGSEVNLKLQVTLAYLQALAAVEQSKLSATQEQTTLDQIKRLEEMNREGAILPGLLADLRAQYASDQMASMQDRQQIDINLQALFGFMNIPFEMPIQLSPLDPSVLAPASEAATRVQGMKHPSIQASLLRIQSEEFNLKSSRALRYPSLNFGLNLGSNYSSAFENVRYTRQLNNNFNYSGFLSLGVPILNNYNVRRSIKQAEWAIDRAKSNAELIKNTTQQNIEQALLFHKNASERLLLAQNQLDAFAESFRIAEVRFNEGATNSVVEYLLAKNNFNRAQNNYLAAKYNQSFREKVIAFYNQFE
jgi:outer membrane protein